MNDSEHDIPNRDVLDLGAASIETRGIPKHGAFEALMGQDYRESAD